jgi:predicted Ser/Thr protein kinase
VKPQFRGLKKLGEGSIANVYSAKYKGKPVIVKVAAEFETPLSYSKKQILVEAQILGKLQRFPFVPRVIEVGVDYLVTEDAGGESLLTILDKKGLTAAKLLAVAIAVAGMISLIHKRGVAHRDLEYRNILLTPKGVVIIDFDMASTDPDPEVFESAMSRDIQEVLGIVRQVLDDKGIPVSARKTLLEVIREARRLVRGNRVTADTGAEIAQSLVPVVVQLGSRARRGYAMKEPLLTVIAVD